MKTQIKGAAKRLVISLLLAAGLGGCAVYGPPYSAYDGGYAYGGPAYAYPPVSLDLGFSYYDRGPRHHYGHGGRHHHGHGWGHHHGRGHHGGGHHRGWGRGRH